MNHDTRIDKSLPVPIYYQLEQIIRHQIETGQLKKGDMLPTEQELQKVYGVSRASIRNALGSLVREGLLERKRSLGTYVTGPKFEETFASLNSSTIPLVSQGRQVETRILEYTVGLPEPSVARLLQLAPEEQVITLKRLTCVDGQPTNLATAYLIRSVAPGFSDKDLTPTGLAQSLYHVLQHKYGVVLAEVDITVSPVALDRASARLLGTKTGTPAIMRTRLVHGDDRRSPILYSAALFCHAFTLHAKRGVRMIDAQ